MDLKQSYQERVESATNAAAAQLFRLMAEKKTNLTFGNDETDPTRFIELCDKIGPEIAVLKTHIDLIENFTPSITNKLLELAKKHKFMIFEDRKFGDISNTSKLQYTKGIFRIAEWANFVNVNIIPGPGVIEGIGEAITEKNDQIARGILLLSQMSSAGSFANGSYTEKSLEFSKLYPNFIAGHIGNGGDVAELAKLAKASGPGHAILVPGVRIGAKGDDKGQRYSTPEGAVSNGADSIIVGRGIYKADDPLTSAKAYREAGWSAYLKRIQV
jgi:orotidine 5'-phosphate decarboxylase subfamily 1